MIPAYSPQARGRSEHNFSTWEGHLPQELRLRGARHLEAANRFLREHYIDEFNTRFQVLATQRGVHSCTAPAKIWTDLRAHGAGAYSAACRASGGGQDHAAA